MIPEVKNADSTLVYKATSLSSSWYAMSSNFLTERLMICNLMSYLNILNLSVIDNK